MFNLNGEKTQETKKCQCTVLIWITTHLRCKLAFQIILTLLLLKQSSHPGYTFQDAVFILFTLCYTLPDLAIMLSGCVWVKNTVHEVLQYQ